MALHFMEAEIPIPSQGLPTGLCVWGGKWGGGAEIRQGSFSFIPASDKGPPAPSPPPPLGLPAVVLVTGAALGLPKPPSPTTAGQSCPKHITGSRLQRMSWNQAQPPFSAKTLPFSARARQARQWGHHYPNNEASGMQEAD